MKKTECRSCGSSELELVYDFGPQPLAGSFPLEPDSASEARRYMLDLTQCRHCALLQITNLPPIQEVFHDDYRYSSSTIPDLVRHFEGYADYLTKKLPPRARILEFGCNDGLLLGLLRDRGFDCVGIDASDNVAALARAKGLDVRTGFLSTELVREEGLEGAFDAVTCSNVFAHIDGIRDAAHAVRSLLRPGGLFFIEVHDGDILASEAQFDTIYHEHLTYFTEATLTGFVEQEQFEFLECLRTPMHGGGLRFASRYRPERAKPQEDRPTLIDGERFGSTIDRCRADLDALARAHGPLYGYGAAGRSQMFINMTRSGAHFAAVFDDSPFRQNRYIVGTDIPITDYAGNEGEVCVILAWNYAEAIAERVRGRFKRVVTLLPKFREW